MTRYSDADVIPYSTDPVVSQTIERICVHSKGFSGQVSGAH